MFDNGRPTRKQELIIMCSLGLAGLVAGITTALNASIWLTPAAGITYSPDLQGTRQTSVYLSFVGFLTFLLCAVLFPIFGQEPQAPYALRTSRAWLLNACFFWVLWATGAGALANQQGAPICEGTAPGQNSQTPCVLGSVALTFAWIAWIIATLHLVSAGFWFWKRNDVVPAKHFWQRSYLTTRFKLGHDDRAAAQHGSRRAGRSAGPSTGASGANHHAQSHASTETVIDRS